jgi:hypothetical protein
MLTSIHNQLNGCHFHIEWAQLPLLLQHLEDQNSFAPSIEMLIEYVLMIEHLPSRREVSLLALGSSWTDWSHVWGREVYLKRALEKPNLEYPCDSDD